MGRALIENYCDPQVILGTESSLKGCCADIYWLTVQFTSAGPLCNRARSSPPSYHLR